MFEITGALTYILPTMIVVGVTKAVSERFGHGGIADRMIYLNGYPFLDSKEEHTFGVPVSQVMASRAICLPARGMQLKQMERLMNENQYQGYPIVEDVKSKMLVGYIGRTELRYAIDRAKIEAHANASSTCYFTSPSTSSSSPALTTNSTSRTMPATSSSISLDFTRYIDPTPLSVHPRLPLETVMEMFSKMGPRVILIEYRGRLTGLVTIKDCLKYQFKVEAGHGGGAGGTGSVGDEGMERLAGWRRGVVNWIRRKAGLKEVGEVRLLNPTMGTPAVSRSGDEGGERQESGGLVRERDEAFTVGEDDEDGDGRGVELENRRREHG
jgi:chloride channel 3/4/5